MFLKEMNGLGILSASLSVNWMPYKSEIDLTHSDIIPMVTTPNVRVSYNTFALLTKQIACFERKVTYLL